MIETNSEIVHEYTQKQWNAINRRINHEIQININKVGNAPALLILPNHKISKEYSLIDYIVNPNLCSKENKIFLSLMKTYGFSKPVDTLYHQFPMKVFRIKVRRIVRK